MGVRLQRESFDTGAELSRLVGGRADAGAAVTFTGLCRGGEGTERIDALTLDHYPAMAQAELERIESEARGRWPLLDVLVVHRYGRLEPGEVIVLVAVLAQHRRAAFEAAEFIMDVLKTDAPFWKYEERGGGGHWVEAARTDDLARKRWDDDAL